MSVTKWKPCLDNAGMLGMQVDNGRGAWVIAEHYDHLEQENAQLKTLVERLKLEAQIHAQEARTANATIYEIYQAVSEGTGEPGNWSGAKPVVEMIDQLKAELAEKTGQYNSSVQTRMAFREAYKRERDEVKKLKAENEGLSKKVKNLTAWYDKMFGVPCEEIRHQQQVEVLEEERDKLRADCDTWAKKYVELDQSRDILKAELAQCREEIAIDTPPDRNLWLLDLRRRLALGCQFNKHDCMRVLKLARIAQRDLAAEQQRAARLREALRSLRNEVSGIVSLDEKMLRETFGNTNISILLLRINKADVALEEDKA